MVKRPTGPFHDASHHTDARESQLKDPLELNPERDKDNVDRTPKPPTHVPGGSAANLAPRGALGTKRGLAAPIVPTKPMSLGVRKDDFDKDLSVDGKILSVDGYRFAAKVNDLPSQRGIGGGKIAKLEIMDGDRIAARYDRGWDIAPQTARDREAFEKVRTVLDPPEREFKPIAPRTPDKDRGRDR